MSDPLDRSEHGPLQVHAVDARGLELGLALDELVDRDGALLLLAAELGVDELVRGGLLLERSLRRGEIGLDSGDASAESAWQTPPANALGQRRLLGLELLVALGPSGKLQLDLLLERLDLDDAPASQLRLRTRPMHSSDTRVVRSSSAVSCSQRDSIAATLAVSSSICVFWPARSLFRPAMRLLA